MKKSFIGLFAAAMLVATVTSCEKEEQTPSSAGSARVQGIVEVNTNLANDTLSDGSYELKWELVPSGTKLTFVIDAYDLDLNPDPSYDYKDQSYSTTVGTNGEYSIDLPANERAFSAEVRFNDFEADVIDYSNDPADTLANGSPATVSTRTTFSRSNTSVTIFNGAVVVEDYKY